MICAQSGIFNAKSGATFDSCFKAYDFELSFDRTSMLVANVSKSYPTTNSRIRDAASLDVPEKRSGFTLHTAADDRVRW